jgi:hypothetical protein
MGKGKRKRVSQLSRPGGSFWPSRARARARPRRQAAHSARHWGRRRGDGARMVSWRGPTCQRKGGADGVER